jgi:hypothetical protein
LLDALREARSRNPASAPMLSSEADRRAADALRDLQAANRSIHRSAYAALAEDRPEEALRLLKSDLLDPRALPPEGRKDDEADQPARAWRDLAALAYFVDYDLAAEAYEHVLRHEEADAWSAIFLARLYRASARTPLAREVVAAALTGAEHASSKAALHEEAAMAARACGDLPAARSAYQQCVIIYTRLAEAGGANEKRALATAHLRVGDVAREEIDLDAARAAYIQAHQILVAFAESDGGSPDALRELAAVHVRFGLLERAHDDLERARAAYEKDLVIRRKLMEQAPGDRNIRRDLATSHMRLGLLARDYGELAEARAAFGEEIAIREAVAGENPDDVQLTGELTASYARLAHLARREGDEAKAAHDLASARRHFEEDLQLRERLRGLDAPNPVRDRDVLISRKRLEQVAASEALLAKVAEMKREATAREAEKRDRAAAQALLNANRIEGDLAREKGDVETARRSYLADITTRQAISDEEPGDAKAADELRAACMRLAQLARRQGEEAMASGALAIARRCFDEDLQLRERLRRLDASNPARDRDVLISNKRLEQLAWFETKSATQEKRTAAREKAVAAAQLIARRGEGDKALRSGDHGTARRCYEADIAARQALVDEQPGDADLAAALLAGLMRLAQLARRQGEDAKTAGDLPSARHYCQEDLELRERLRRADPASEARSRDVLISRKRLEQVAALEQRAAMRDKQAAATLMASHLREAQRVRRQGEEAKAAGDLNAARRYCAEDLELRERLRNADPSNPGRARDVLISRKRMEQVAGLERQAAARHEKSALAQLADYRTKGDRARRTGDYKAARRSYQADIAARQTIADAHPGDALAATALLAAHMRLAQLARREGEEAKAAGDLTAARGYCEEDLAVRERMRALDDASPSRARDVLISSKRLEQLSGLEEQAAAREKQAAVRKEKADLARLAAHRTKGDLACQKGDFAAARRSYQADVTARQAIVDERPRDTNAADELRAGYLRLGRLARLEGNAARHNGDLTAALAAFEADLAIRKSLAEREHPAGASVQEVSMSRQRLGALLRVCGDAARSAGDWPAAIDLHERDLALRGEIAAGDRASADRRAERSVSGARLGAVLRLGGEAAFAQGDLAAARRWFERDLVLRRERVEAEPASPALSRDLAHSLRRLGLLTRSAAEAAREGGDLDGERQAKGEGAELNRELLALLPDKVARSREIRVPPALPPTSARQIGDEARAAGELDAARRAYEEDVRLWEGRLATGEGRPDDLVVGYLRLGHILRTMANAARAAARIEDESNLLGEDVTVRRKLLGLRPADPAYKEGLATSLTRLAAAAKVAGNLATARTVYAEELGIREERAVEAPGERTNQELLASYLRLGQVLRAAGDAARQAGDLSAARTAHQEDLELREALMLRYPDDAARRRDHATSQLRLKRLAGKPARRRGPARSTAGA